MALLIDVWAGEVHQSHVGTLTTESWEDACKFIEQQVEAGMLCNILHTDFKAPPDRRGEAERALRETLNE